MNLKSYLLDLLNAEYLMQWVHINGGVTLVMSLNPLLHKEAVDLLEPTSPLTRTSQPWGG
jgi:hypothetical protein